MRNPRPLYIGAGALIFTGLICTVCLFCVVTFGILTPTSSESPTPRIIRRSTAAPVIPTSVAAGDTTAPVITDGGQETVPENNGGAASQVESPGETTGGEQSQETQPVQPPAAEPQPEGQEVNPQEEQAVVEQNEGGDAANQVEQLPPTPTPVPQIVSSDARLVITRYDPATEFVDIKNIGGAAQDLAGWRLVSETGGEECPLGGTLGPNETLRIWAQTANAEQGDYNCGYNEEIWSDDEEDAATLYDANDQMIYRRK